MSYDRMLATAYDKRYNRALHCPVTCDLCDEQVEQLDALKFGRDWLCPHCGTKCDSCCGVMRHEDAIAVDGDQWCRECLKQALKELFQ